MVEGPPVPADAHREVLRGIEVRPILPSERGQWDALVNAHHYLGLRALVGKTLRYVALFQGRWLALLGWQGAVREGGTQVHLLSAFLQHQGVTVAQRF